MADIAVRAESADDARAACDGARRALEFLRGVDIGAPAGTTIEIVQAMPEALAGRAVGCYVGETRRILLLGYAQFEALGRWLRVAVDRELYRAAAAHEMAHAAVGCHVAPARLPVAAQEYVAYVVMFATMAPRLRERVLARFPGQGFGSTLQINEITHLVDPQQFAADAWRHYLKKRDRAAWLRDVVAGGVVQELHGDGP